MLASQKAVAVIVGDENENLFFPRVTLKVRGKEKGGQCRLLVGKNGETREKN